MLVSEFVVWCKPSVVIHKPIRMVSWQGSLKWASSCGESTRVFGLTIKHFSREASDNLDVSRLLTWNQLLSASFDGKHLNLYSNDIPVKSYFFKNSFFKCAHNLH